MADAWIGKYGPDQIYGVCNPVHRKRSADADALAYRYGKRSAEADAEAEADDYAWYGYYFNGYSRIYGCCYPYTYAAMHLAHLLH